MLGFRDAAARDQLLEASLRAERLDKHSTHITLRSRLASGEVLLILGDLTYQALLWWRFLVLHCFIIHLFAGVKIR